MTTAIIERLPSWVHLVVMAVLFTWLPALLYLVAGAFGGWLGVVGVNAFIISAAISDREKNGSKETGA